MGGRPGKPAGPFQERVLERAPYLEKVPARWPPQQATFSAGCFWGPQLAFERLPGVLWTKAGYIGGHDPNPTYSAVSQGITGHAEAVHLEFDPGLISYRDLCRVFFEIHDPTTRDSQGGDSGPQYRSGIYFYSEEQERVARDEMADASERLGVECVTEIAAAGTFHPAEEYHNHWLGKGGRYMEAQSTRKGEKGPIKCYG